MDEEREGWLEPLPVRRVVRSRDAGLPPDRWPLTLAPVAQVLRDGLDLARATVLVGENGSGKSTLVEAIAMAFGLSPEGGSTNAVHSTRPSESALHGDLSLVRGAGASRWGYFLRAETMHGLFTFLEDLGGSGDPEFHRLSHGESFMEMLRTRRFAGDGFLVLDEPEAGLSFTHQLALVGSLADAVREPGRQVLVATHSPVVAALPGARILQLSETGSSRWSGRTSTSSTTIAASSPVPTATCATSCPTDPCRRGRAQRSSTMRSIV